MSRTHLVPHVGWLACLLIAGTTAIGQTKSPVKKTDEKFARSPAQRTLDQSADENKFTFIVFYKTDTPAVRAMLKSAKDGVAKRSDKAVVALVQITDPAEKPLVDQFDVARSPMPLTLAVASNQAVTGIFSKELKDEHIEEALVTPTMTRCMKSLQEGKLVFVCLNKADVDAAPPVVSEMQLDPEFASRIAVTSLSIGNPEEARFLKQLQVDSRQFRTSTAALLAPPGVLIGKFNGASTKDEVTAALHKAGKCCDDPNCKHNHGTSTQRPANSRRK
ncbi:MAG: hypothetical protein JSS02_10715 [Planctomycetes bacterium]|nr:hypothetical protein [Planctomycetota bacterium]